MDLAVIQAVLVLSEITYIVNFTSKLFRFLFKIVNLLKQAEGTILTQTWIGIFQMFFFEKKQKKNIKKKNYFIIKIFLKFTGQKRVI